jgi:hypothetical protein
MQTPALILCIFLAACGKQRFDRCPLIQQVPRRKGIHPADPAVPDKERRSFHVIQHGKNSFCLFHVVPPCVIGCAEITIHCTADFDKILLNSLYQKLRK